MNYEKHIQYSIEGHTVKIDGTNSAADFLISADCLPNKHGVHSGCYKAALWLYSQLEEIPRYIEGHSMGGGIAQALAVILLHKGYDVEIRIKGAYPACTKRYRVKGLSMVYGNDPVPGLFPWFQFHCDVEYFGPARKWWKIYFKLRVCPRHCICSPPALKRTS